MGLPEVEVVFYIEVLGKEREKVEEEVESIRKRLEEDKLEVRRIDAGEVIEDPSMDPLRFSSFVEAQIRAPLDGIFMASVEYAPTIVEVVRPGSVEITADDLSDLLRNLVGRVSDLLGKFNYQPEVPRLDDVPMPPVGFDEEELWELIDEGRNVLYSLKLNVASDDEELVKENVSKLLLLEGVGVNSIDFEVSPGGLTVNVEAVSPFEALVNTAVKYLPSDVKILEPGIVDINSFELQNSLSDVGSFVALVKSREERIEAYERDVFSFRLS